MKELQIEMMNLEVQWQHLLTDILGQTSVGRAQLLKPDEGPADEEEWEMMRFVPDIIFTPSGAAEPIAIEFKMFRWRSDWRSRVGDATAFLKMLLEQTNYTRGALVVSLEIDPTDRDIFRQVADSSVELWDLNDLRRFAARNPELLESLEELSRDTLIESSSAKFFPRQAEALKGASIAARLRATDSGLNGSRAFEDLCHEGIRFLFGQEIQKLIPQNRTDDGLDRMDLIGRIRSGSDSFWALVSSDFSTRYVVFEAKNYAAPIGQDAINSTSKYLFRAGLRNVAIVIAREGASDQAIKASAGHLREDRKLILVISKDDLCVMLEGADSGDPPENLLFDRMDETLMAMGGNPPIFDGVHS